MGPAWGPTAQELDSRASGDRGEPADVCPARGQLFPGPQQLDGHRPSVVGSSDFLRETGNLDFPMKFPDFQILVINSNIELCAN